MIPTIKCDKANLLELFRNNIAILGHGVHICVIDGHQRAGNQNRKGDGLDVIRDVQHSLYYI